MFKLWIKIRNLTHTDFYFYKNLIIKPSFVLINSYNLISVHYFIYISAFIALINTTLGKRVPLNKFTSSHQYIINTKIKLLTL